MLYKKYILIIGLMVGGNAALFGAEAVNPKQNILTEKYAYLNEFNTKFGLPKSTPRETTELLILAMVHGSTQLKDGKIVIDLKKGVTTTRDALFKKATYSLLNKGMLEALQSITAIEKNEYDNKIKPWIGDGFDFIFRGIKYLNDEAKDQALSAYLKDDFIPYLIKKKVVWLTEEGIKYATKTTLSRHEYGKFILAAYDLLCIVPVIGVEVEELPKKVLEHLYDKGLVIGKRLVQKYRMSRAVSPSIILQAA